MSYTLEEKTHRDCKNDPSKSEYFKKITIVSTQQDRSETQPEVELHSSGAQWDALYEVANAQAGLFAIDQAQAIGFSDQLLAKHARGGRLERLHRGIYRITRLPPHEHEEYVLAWLWSGRRGVISHESALLLHGLSDALPSRIHLTLPGARAEFHTKVPETFIVHFGEVPEAERAWLGAVPLTRPARTINDVARDHGDAILVEQAIEQGIRRGLFHVRDVARAAAYTAALGMPGTPIFPEAVADLGGMWAHRGFRGRFAGVPAADWPVRIAEIAAAFGGRVYSQERSPRSREVLLGIVFPLPGPDEACWERLCDELGRAL